MTAYSSLGSPARPAKYQVQADAHPLLLADPAITQVATAHGASAAAVALGWAMRRGVALIPKSAHRERIASNLAGTLALAPSLLIVSFPALTKPKNASVRNSKHMKTFNARWHVKCLWPDFFSKIRTIWHGGVFQNNAAEADSNHCAIVPPSPHLTWNPTSPDP